MRIASGIASTETNDHSPCLTRLRMRLYMRASERTGKTPLHTIDRADAPNRVARSLRLSPDLDKELMTAARANGTSHTATAEHAIRRGLERQSLTPEMLRLLFGEGSAGLILLIGRAMAQAGNSRMRQARQQDDELPHPWFLDADGYAAAVTAALRVLEEFRPEGQPVNDPNDPIVQGEQRYVIAAVSAVIMAALGGPYPLGEREWTELVSVSLGDLIHQSHWLREQQRRDAAIEAARASERASRVPGQP
jgi:hypothetical protein